jgi:lipoprotein signal peptidase
MLEFLADNAKPFLLITVCLGGGAAWLAGRAMAETWRPMWQAIAYMLLLGGAVRFIHYALAGGTFLSPSAYALDTVVAIGFVVAGFRTMRRRQMARQYGFLFGPGARSNSAP